MSTEAIPKGHPKGLYFIFVTGMWERFSYYGMRALFVLYMTKALFFDKALSSQIYGSYTGLVYLTPLIGGYMADKYWGNRKSIIVGGILMAIGQLLLFLSGTFYQEAQLAGILMFTGLGFLIFGNGFFKPCITTVVGQLYPPGDKRIDSGFTIYYMGINLGAFLAPLACGFWGDTGNPADFKWGFLIAAIGMIFSVIFFIILKNKMMIGPDGEQLGVRPEYMNKKTDTPESAPISKKSTWVWSLICVVLIGLFYVLLDKDIIGAFIFAITIAAPGYILSDPGLTKIEKQRIWVIYIVAFFVIFFWSAFEQAGVSLTYFAEEQTNREFLGKLIPASYFQSVNAVAIVIFAPIFVWLWGGLGKKNAEPNSLQKQAIGLFLLALGYLIIAFGVKGIAPGIKVSMIWLLSLYTIHTFGELCLSPIGLSMVNKLAPLKFASLLMGVWFMSTSAANKFSGTLSSLYPEPVVAISTVEKINQEKNLRLFPEEYDISKAGIVQGVPTISFDKIQLSQIKDETVKTEVLATLSDNQLDNSKMFIGIKISNLYDFFLLFVGMAGIASIILLILNKTLIKMMHGVK